MELMRLIVATFFYSPSKFAEVPFERSLSGIMPICSAFSISYDARCHCTALLIETGNIRQRLIFPIFLAN
jgi:hypothetical protein